MFRPFQVEQFLSEHEEGVAYNFSESGVHPLTLGELLAFAGTSTDALSGVLMDYPEVRGTEAAHPNCRALHGRQGLSRYQGVFSVVPPQASAMSFVRYNLPIGSRELASRLYLEKDMLVVPGECFGLENHFRFSSALAEDYLAEGLVRLNALVGELLEG